MSKKVLFSPIERLLEIFQASRPENMVLFNVKEPERQVINEL